MNKITVVKSGFGNELQWKYTWGGFIFMIRLLGTNHVSPIAYIGLSKHWKSGWTFEFLKFNLWVFKVRYRWVNIPFINNPLFLLSIFALWNWALASGDSISMHGRLWENWRVGNGNYYFNSATFCCQWSYSRHLHNRMCLLAFPWIAVDKMFGI